MGCMQRSMEQTISFDDGNRELSDALVAHLVGDAMQGIPAHAMQYFQQHAWKPIKNR